MSANDGGPAFPVDEIHDQLPWTPGGACRHYPAERGMTLRDYFAAKAMAVVWANLDPDSVRDISITQTAKAAYMLADAMLAAREASNGK